MNNASLEGKVLVASENVTTVFIEYSGEQSDAAAAMPLECDVWGIPSRAVLQVILIFMIMVNIAAAVIVFGVPVNVRGKHVAFLFICVRTLNILDIYQCMVLLFLPLGMPPDCQNPNIVYCYISGFCFGTATIWSPLVAIIMALDRFFAVFFHVRYKANPQTKLKCTVLVAVLGVYGVYFTLPFYTDFGKYLAVSWLSLCSFEWGVEYRMFNLILMLTTALLTVVLMTANLAIVCKVHHQQREVERLKASAQVNYNKASDGIQIPSGSTKKRAHMPKSKSVDHLSSSPEKKSASNFPFRSLHERRGKLISPLSIIFSPLSSSPKKEKTPGNAIVSECVTPEISIATPNDPPTVCQRPKSFSPAPLSPPTNDSALLFPPSPSPNKLSPDDYRPPSPLVLTDGGRNSPRMVTKMTLAASGRNNPLQRLSSTENLIDGKEGALATFGHRTNDPNLLRKKALGNINTATKRNASSEPFLDRSFNSDDESRQNSLSRDSSINSLFSTFISSRIMSWRSRAPHPKGVRRNVSRITKMTTAICTMFAILYVPFLIRKLIQLIPPTYQEVPYAAEIITLFGPLLSPLCNPILYVFFNPHYRENCKRIHRKIFRRGRYTPASEIGVIPSTSNKSSRGSKKIKRKKRKIKNGKIERGGKTDERVNFSRSMDDVFVASGNHHRDDVSISEEHSERYKDSYVTSSNPSSPAAHDDTKRRQSLRQLHLRRIQNLQYRRANSEDFLN